MIKSNVTSSTNFDICDFNDHGDNDGEKAWYVSQLSISGVNKRTRNCRKYFPALSQMIHNDTNEVKTNRFNDDADADLKLAFTFVIHDQVGLFELLFYLIFRPKHSYCVFMGSNVPVRFLKTVLRLINCYRQMFESEILVLQGSNPIQWGDISLLEADLKCFEALLKSKR